MNVETAFEKSRRMDMMLDGIQSRCPLDHSGKFSFQSNKRWTLGFSVVGIGELHTVGCLWRMSEVMVSVVELEYSIATSKI